MVENKYYERIIRYLDLLESGERISGAGFVKIEVRGMDIRLAVTVRGLHPTDTYERDVMLQAGDGEFAVGRISLKEGQGQFAYHTVMDYSQLQGIRIALGGVREICGRWQENKRGYKNAAKNNVTENDKGQKTGAGDDGEQIAIAQEPQTTKELQDNQAVPWDEIRAAEESLERTDRILAEMAGKETERTPIGKTERTLLGKAERTPLEKTERAPSGNTEGMSARNAKIMPEGKAARRLSSGNPTGREKRPVRLMEDKWQQIWAIYPHIHPFQDEREYLSIGPADFVLLSGEAYRVANNSFLLHGYYNYDHLILTKIEKRGEVSYYIGVPGNYYEREKQVAIMFGFESFECGTEPAQAGDFGYYMMRTQL